MQDTALGLLAGGAALGPDTFKFFLSMGVPLRQLYGQTELAGAYTIHEANDVDFDSVGIPFRNAQVRIDNPDHNHLRVFADRVCRASQRLVGC